MVKAEQVIREIERENDRRGVMGMLFRAIFAPIRWVREAIARAKEADAYTLYTVAAVGSILVVSAADVYRALKGKNGP